MAPTRSASSEIEGTGQRRSNRHGFFGSGMKTGHFHFPQVGISPPHKRRTLSQSTRSSDRATRTAGLPSANSKILNLMPGIRIVVGGNRRSGQNGRTTRTTLSPVDGSGNGVGLAGRVGDLTFRGLKPPAAQYSQLSPSQARMPAMYEAHFRSPNSR